MVEKIPVNIPKVSMAAEEVMFVGWLVPDGAQVAEGESIYTVTTDKVDMDVEAAASGVLRHGDVVEEETYDVGLEIGFIEIA